MNNRDWERFGDEIRRSVQDAIDTGDFSRLNQTVTDTVNGAVEYVSDTVRNAGSRVKRDTVYRNAETDDNDGYYNRGYQNAGSGTQNGSTADNSRKQVPAMLYTKTSGIKAGGLALTIGGVTVSIFCILMAVLLAVGGVTTGTDGVVIFGLVFFGLLAVIFGSLAGVGRGMLGRVNRFRTYVRMLGEREYCNVKELADGFGKSQKFLVKDIDKMIRKGWFRQGHFDEQKTCLMVSDQAYWQYTELMKRTKQQKEMEAEVKEAARKQAEEMTGLSPEAQEVIRTGEEYIRKIHACNDAIPGEEISAKISRMEMLVDRIFDRVEQQPESISDLHRMMDYYLPTTVKLLEAYEELDAQPVQGENILTSKKEIEKTLDTLNKAFEKLLDDLFQDKAWDLSSDISVLHTILAQEGLTEDGFPKVK